MAKCIFPGQYSPNCTPEHLLETFQDVFIEAGFKYLGLNPLHGRAITKLFSYIIYLFHLFLRRWEEYPSHILFSPPYEYCMCFVLKSGFEQAFMSLISVTVTHLDP